MLDTEAARGEILEHLWRYLRKSGTSDVGTPRLTDIPLLLNGDVRDIRRRSAVAVLQAIAVPDALASFSEVLQRLPTSIGFQRVDVEGHVAGIVDWSASHARRAVDPSRFVCNVPIRTSELPLNRAFRAIVEGYLGCVLILRSAVRRSVDGSAYSEIVGDGRFLEAAASDLLEILAHRKLSEVRPASVIEDRMVDRLVVMGLDSRLAADEIVDVLDESPSPQSLVSLIARYLLAPSSVPVLFEMLVAVRIVRSLESAGLSPRPWRVLAKGQPFAALTDTAGGEWRVYWQRSHWLIDGIDWRASSRYERTMRVAGVKSAALRPDVVVVDPADQACLFEVKYTDDAGTPRERDGVIEMMGYLYDIDSLPTSWADPLGVVVAHGSAATPGDDSILVCDESASALESVVRRLIERVSRPVASPSVG